MSLSITQVSDVGLWLSCWRNIDHISQLIWTKVAQSIYRHKILYQLDNKQNLLTNTEVILSWIIENCYFEPCYCKRDLISQSVWTKVAQSIYRHKILDEFDYEWNMSSNMGVNCPERLKIAFWTLLAWIWTKVALSIYRHKTSDQFKHEQNLSSNTKLFTLE